MDIDILISLNEHRKARRAAILVNAIDAGTARLIVEGDALDNDGLEPEIAEISYTCIDTAIYTCKGFFDSDLKWREGRFWPQYLHLIDALGLPDLKQPELG